MQIRINLIFDALDYPLADSGTRQRPGFKRAAPPELPSEEAAIAAFIRLKGVTRCPTAYAVPSRGYVTAADQAALERYAAERERLRTSKTALIIDGLQRRS